MNPLCTLVFVAAVITATYGYCYDAEVAADQYFDESFIYKDSIPHPGKLIQSDLNGLKNHDHLYFLDTSASCFNETGYFSKSYTATGDYAYQCVCPSPRKRIDAVYVRKDICFVVYPEKQDIQYAQCGGHCSFDYGTQIATASRGYFCVHQSFVKREFLVWCPSHASVLTSAVASSSGHVHHAATSGIGAGVYHPYGSFHRVTYVLPTLCSCRGYFCDNHGVPIH